MIYAFHHLPPLPQPSYRSTAQGKTSLTPLTPLTLLIPLIPIRERETGKVIKKTPLVCAMSLIGCTLMLPTLAHASADEPTHKNMTNPANFAAADVATVDIEVADIATNDVTTPESKTADTSTDSSFDTTIDTSAAQDALARLSQYYVHHPESANHPKPDNATTSSSPPVAHTNLTERVDNQPKDRINNRTSNKIDSTASHLSKSIENWIGADAPLCSGQWVYPSSVKDIRGSISGIATQTDGFGNQASDQTNHQANAQNSNQNSILAVTSKPDPALKAQADYGYYDNVRYATLTGNVIVQQGNQLIQADKVLVDVQTQNATASGNVLFADVPADAVDIHSAASLKDNNNTNPANPTFTNDKDNTSKPLNARQQLSQGGLLTVANQVAYDSQNQTAHADDVAFASIPLQAHGYAKHLSKTGDNRLDLTDVMFTTCPPDDPKWRLQAAAIELDDASGRGVARHARLEIGSVPVVYLPYFNFPIDDRRASGFLLPSVRLRDNGQVELQTPYYANLAANMDATLTPRVFSDRNPMMSAELRYLNDKFGYSQIQGDYLPNDRQYHDQNRKSLSARHLWQSKHIDNLTGEAVYQYVSDPDFMDDFEVFDKGFGANGFGTLDNTAHLPRSAQLNYFNEYVTASLKAETYQNLDVTDTFGNPVTDANNPYAKLPQFTASYILPLDKWANRHGDFNTTWGDTFIDKVAGNVRITGVHDSGYFQKNITDNSAPEKSGFRMYNKLTAAYPMHNTWGYAVPSIGVQQLFARYDESTTLNNQISKDNRQQNVVLPSIALDTGMYFKKMGSPFGWFDDTSQGTDGTITTKNGHQLLTPRLKYTYTPFKDQNSLPNFNTRIASLSYDQLFADSWFLGNDRIQDLHAITPAINYRYIDSQGNTRLDMGIAEQFYLSDGKTRLSDFISTPNATDPSRPNTTPNEALFSERSSGMVASIQAQPIKQLWWDVNVASKPNYDLNFITSQLRYQPTDNSMISLGVINRQADRNTNQLPLQAYTASLVMPMNQNWRLMAQGQFDENRRQVTDGLLGIDFQDCCIGASVYVRRHTNDLDVTAKPENAVMAELRLTGLSPKSGRFSRLLQDRVYGFTPVQDAWVK